MKVLKYSGVKNLADIPKFQGNAHGKKAGVHASHAENLQ